MPLLDVWETILLASYVMYLVKNFVDGCGGDTDMFCLREGSPAFIKLNRNETASLERIFADYCCKVEPAQFRSVIDATMPNHAINSAVCRKRLTKQMDAIKKVRMP
jgi:hypothetical protein